MIDSEIGHNNNSYWTFIKDADESLMITASKILESGGSGKKLKIRLRDGDKDKLLKFLLEEL